MAMEYINYIKSKAHLSTATKSEQPILSEEDEEFLNRITSDGNPPQLPPRPNILDLPVAGDPQRNDAQIALLDGAQHVPLPETPNELFEEPPPLAERELSDVAKTEKKPRKTWSWLRRDSRSAKQKATAAGLEDIAAGLKGPDAKPNEDGVVDDRDAKQEEEDMTIVLERLNLAAVNNRVFSISDETQELMRNFNVVIKDLINGVPTAYGDLESLLTNGDKQLQKTYSSLPPFLQTLIEQLPARLTQGFAPEIMAAAAERNQKAGFNMATAGKAAGYAKKMGFKTPNLRDLVGKPGALATLLRSIITYLRARFPAFLGMNVLWSLALFVLLFVFWYCHKRGKEVRLEKERELTEREVAQLEKEYVAMNPGEIPTTTAAEGASIEEIQAGMREVQEARQRAAEEGVASKDVESLQAEPSMQPTTAVSAEGK